MIKEAGETDPKKLIEIILSDEKLSNSLGGRVFGDVPIIRPASQLENYLPEKYTEMKELAKDPRLFTRPTELFVRQAELMSDFEDDFEFSGRFINYFPTYRAMNDSQLRGYFSWRTKVRKGESPAVCLSFVFVYIYELLNLVGVASPQEGFEKIVNIWKAYSEEHPQLDFYIPGWLTEFAVYYGLPTETVSTCSDNGFYADFSVLLSPSEDDERLFEALNALGSYDIKRSRLFKSSPELLKKLCTAFYRDLFGYFSGGHVRSFAETCFGRVREEYCRIMGSAVFFDKRKYEDYEYRLNDIVVYRCVKGSWKKTGLDTRPQKSSLLGSYMKAADCALRAATGFQFQMKPVKLPKYASGFLEDEIARLLEEKRKSEMPVVGIDLSKLDSIRVSADKTRDMLMTEEEAAESGEMPEPAPAPQLILPEPEPVPPAPPAAENAACGLTAVEAGFLTRLLGGGDYKAFVRESGKMLSIITDSVNEKLFDAFGDTVLDFDGEEPIVIEDYEEELKGLLGL